MQDLQLKMERFGAVKSCRLVVDKDTKKPKGTAFIDFEEPSAAEKAVAACSKDKYVWPLISPPHLQPLLPVDSLRMQYVMPWNAKLL